MTDDFKAEMDKRGFNSTECSTQKIMQLISDDTATQTKAIITLIIEKTNLAERSIANAMSRSEVEYQVHQMEDEEELEVEMPNDPTYDEVQDIQRMRLVASAPQLYQKDSTQLDLRKSPHPRVSCVSSALSQWHSSSHL